MALQDITFRVECEGRDGDCYIEEIVHFIVLNIKHIYWSTFIHVSLYVFVLQIYFLRREPLVKTSVFIL